jgi:CRP-like cAMP-binding protein
MKVDCTAGQAIIKQGDKGDKFYVVDSGVYEVRVVKEGAPVPADGGSAVLTYNSGGHFGELALLYNKPRGASVFCKEAGRLWALDRLAFRTILMKSPKKALLKTLRRVGVLKSLDTSQVQSINSILTTLYSLL